MKALILDGSEPGDETILKIADETISLLSNGGWGCERLVLHDMDISGCRGCFGCWIDTPGTCVIDDASREVTRKMISSDLLIFLTPVTFGGYSYHLKKAVDRFIPLISPFFENIDGEIRHAKRYLLYPSLAGIGVLDSPDESSERIFRRLVVRNALNMHSPSSASKVIFRTDLIDFIHSKLKKLFEEVGVR